MIVEGGITFQEAKRLDGSRAGKAGDSLRRPPRKLDPLGADPLGVEGPRWRSESRPGDNPPIPGPAAAASDRASLLASPDP